jgi:hypothetical protein
MQHNNASKTSRQTSLIETINQGFLLVNRRLWILMLPLALNLFYWLGPRISFEPLLQRLRALDPETWEMAREQIGEQLGVAISQFDLRQFAFLPFLRPVAQYITLPTSLLDVVTWHVGSLPMFLGAFALINLVGMACITLYLAPLAQGIGAETTVQPTWSRLGRVFGRLLGVVLVFLAAAVITVVPFVVVAVLASLVSQVVGQFILIGWIALFLWMLFMSSFSFDAVVIQNVGPFRALLNSLLMIQRSFWGVVGFLLLSRVIIAGLAVVWQALAVNVAGLLVAMVGSAYISTGLAAAHLIFYRDRLSRITRPPKLMESL